MFTDKELDRFYKQKFNKLERNKHYRVYCYRGKNPHIHTAWAYLDEWGYLCGIESNCFIVGVKSILDEWKTKENKDANL